MRNVFVISVVGILLPAGSLAQNLIEELNGVPIEKYFISQSAQTVLIFESHPTAFRFRATDGAGLGDIDRITVDPEWTGPGDIIVKVSNTTDGTDGAINLKRISLVMNGSGSTSIAGVWITGDLGELGTTIADQISGDMKVDGNLLNAMVVGGVSGNVTINSSSANITTAGASSGSLTFVQTMSGAISIGGNMSGAITSRNGNLGDVTINGNMTQNIQTLDESGSLIGSIGEVRITGDMDGDVLGLPGFCIFCALIELVDVGGSMTGDIIVNGGVRDVIVNGNMSGLIFVRGRLGALGEEGLTVGGTFSGLMFVIASGPINVDGDCTGDMATQLANDRVTIGGELSGLVGIGIPWGDVSIGTDLTGRVQFLTPFDQTLTVVGDVADTGTIDVRGDLTGTIDVGGFLHGEVTIGTGTFAGDFAGRIDVGADFTGKILINGSFLDVDPAKEEIKIVGDMSNTAAIAVDYDGWAVGDDWEANAVIRVGSTNYSESSTAVNNRSVTPNLWHITQCIGDCNNDGTLDSFDIEPFLDILFDQPKYALDYPGLDGSMIYHGDCNCDGVVDSFDIEPFLEKLFSMPANCDCVLRLGGGRIVATSIVKTALLRLAAGVIPAVGQCDEKADRIIDLLTQHAAPRHYANLLNVSAFLAAHYREVNDPRKSRMWLSVYEGLRENFAD